MKSKYTNGQNLLIRNFTRSPLNFMTKEGKKITLTSEGNVSVDIQRIEEDVNGYNTASEWRIKVNSSEVSNIKGLPEKKEGVLIIVSSLVYNLISHVREDVYVIDEPYKNEKKETQYAKSITRPSNSYVMKDYNNIRELLVKLSNTGLSEEQMDLVFEITKITSKIY